MSVVLNIAYFSAHSNNVEINFLHRLFRWISDHWGTLHEHGIVLHTSIKKIDHRFGNKFPTGAEREDGLLDTAGTGELVLLSALPEFYANHLGFENACFHSWA